MHARPRLNLFARQLLIARWEQGWSAPAVAESAGVSRATVGEGRVGALPARHNSELADFGNSGLIMGLTWLRK